MFLDKNSIIIIIKGRPGNTENCSKDDQSRFLKRLYLYTLLSHLLHNLTKLIYTFFYFSLIFK